MLADPHSALREFLAQSDFMRHGGVKTDLDGTAVHEENGRVYVSADGDWIKADARSGTRGRYQFRCVFRCR